MKANKSKQGTTVFINKQGNFYDCLILKDGIYNGHGCRFATAAEARAFKEQMESQKPSEQVSPEQVLPEQVSTEQTDVSEKSFVSEQQTEPETKIEDDGQLSLF